MKLTQVSLDNGSIKLTFSPESSTITLRPYGQSNTHRLLKQFMMIQDSQMDFDFVALCEDNVSFRTRSGVKRVILRPSEPKFSPLLTPEQQQKLAETERRYWFE